MLFMLWLTARLLTRLLVLPNADDGTKDLEILVLRHQLRVLRRKTGRPRLTAGDRVLLAAASRVLPRQRWASSFLVTPQTLLRWHRTLVRRKWTYGKERTPGRPPIDPQTAALILRIARENSRWGCVRICGELRKLGIRVGATTTRTLLRRHGLGPAPCRSGPSWTQFLRAQAEGIVACDLFTVETIRLKTLHVLFFIQLSTRRVVAAGVTAHPDSAWVTQQARNAAMDLHDRGVSVRFLLRDHDAKFTRSFDDVFSSEGGQVLRTPIRAPKANAHAERGSRPCGRSVWTGRWCSAGATCCGCCAAMSATTTSSDRTAASPWPFPRRGRGVRRRLTLERSGVAMCSAALSTSITRSQHNESGLPRPTGRSLSRRSPCEQFGQPWFGLRRPVQQGLEGFPCRIVEPEQPPVGEHVLGALGQGGERELRHRTAFGRSGLVDTCPLRRGQPHMQPVILDRSCGHTPTVRMLGTHVHAERHSCQAAPMSMDVNAVL